MPLTIDTFSRQSAANPLQSTISKSTILKHEKGAIINGQARVKDEKRDRS